MEAQGAPMQLVERQIIKHSNPHFAAIDAAAFASKNLYNAANYVVRQSFIHEGVYLNYHEMHRRMKDHEAYQALPAKVAQWVLRILDNNWQSFFAALSAWREDPSQFLGHPKPPGYKDKQHGRNLLVYTVQALSVPALRNGLICPSMLGVTLQTKRQNVQQVRIVPRQGYYVVEIVYEQAPVQAVVDPALRAGCDIGIDNLATLASDKPGFIPRIVNGRPVKSINQYYNKRRAELQSHLGDRGISHHLEQLTTTRTRRIDHYLHTTSRRIIDLLVAEGIGTLVIGKNMLWKQEVSLGRQTNQQFVAIPHTRFVAMLTYKAQLVGIQAIITEESYTSKASFLDADPLPIYDSHRRETPVFSGKRVKRGMYRAADGTPINADVNGAYNIIRKVAPEAFAHLRGQGSRGCVVHPMRLAA
jgi:putative transposase